MCNRCHDAELVVGKSKTPQEWNRTLYRMADFGVSASDEDWGALFDYLVTNFPPN